MAKKAKTIDDIDAALKRWKTKLKRAFNEVEKLDRQRKRMTATPQAPATMIIEAGTPAPLNPKPSMADLHKTMRWEKPPMIAVPALQAKADADAKIEKAKALRAEMKRKKPVRTKRAPLSTPPASA